MYHNIKSCVFLNGEITDYFVSSTGVRQGENLSPLLFSLFVNDLELFLKEKGCDHLKISNDIDSYVRLMILMYADDTVILANDEKSLQKALNELSEYCKIWKLQVNCNKTKILVFGRRISKANHRFTFEGEEVEIVNSYKYLGITFNYNGTFGLGIKTLCEQANRATFSLLSKSHCLDLPIDIQLDLYDKMIVPILTYGCEVWGHENTELIERMHLSYCKKLLQLKKTTGNMFLYGELGRYPISITIQSRMISYWARIVTGDQSKLCYLMYKVLLNLSKEKLFTCKWLKTITDILDKCGMNNVFDEQIDLNKR